MNQLHTFRCVTGSWVCRNNYQICAKSSVKISLIVQKCEHTVIAKGHGIWSGRRIHIPIHFWSSLIYSWYIRQCCTGYLLAKCVYFVIEINANIWYRNVWVLCAFSFYVVGEFIVISFTLPELYAYCEILR